MSLLLKNYWHVEVIHQVIRLNKTKSFLWNTQNTDRNGIMDKTHTPHTERKITLERVTHDNPHFLEQVTILATPSPPPPPTHTHTHTNTHTRTHTHTLFWEISKTQPTPFIGGIRLGGNPTMALPSSNSNFWKLTLNLKLYK